MNYLNQLWSIIYKLMSILFNTIQLLSSPAKIMNETFEIQLNALKADIDFFSYSIKEVAVDMVKEGFTKYPIFIASEHEVKIGELILSRADYARDNDIYASTLEEMVENKVIDSGKQNDFKENYKGYKTHCCILWLTPTSAQFVYIPYKKGAENLADA